MAETKMFAKAGKAVKRVPKWAWYVSGGVLVAGGIYAVKARKAVDESSGDLATDEGAVGYTDPLNSPGGIIVPATGGAEAVPAEINTDIPTTTLDLLGGVFSDALGAIQAAQPDLGDLLNVLAGAGDPVAGNTGGGTVTVAPTTPTSVAPKPVAAPKPNPCTKLESGYHCGHCVDMGPNAKRCFTGAIGWARIASGGTGVNHYIDVHVRYCSKLERWRVHPNRATNRWAKIWSGSRPGIC